MGKKGEGKGGLILRWGPVQGHDNRHGDEISISLAGYLEVSIGVDSNVHGGIAAALHLQGLLHILGDGIPDGGNHGRIY